MDATPRLGPNHEERLKRARLCLDGLSVGDSFGQRFFYQSTIDFLLKEKALPRPPWQYTDDTVMAMSIYEVLAEHGFIEQDKLAHRFAARYKAEPYRGYAHGAVDLLQGINRGEDWRAAAAELFDGEGSMGNGSAMRVGPVGAYFADDLDALVENAAASAVITHAHPDAKAGAIAVALAVAYAWRSRGEGIAEPESLIDFVLARMPIGKTYDELAIAATIPLTTAPRIAAGRLGNGSYVLCADTVPFCIWSAAKYLHNFEKALWNTVSVGGDMDTTCAIVGGIVAMSADEDGIPAEWLAAREPLDL